MFKESSELRALLAATAVEVAACAQCNASTADICNQNGCGYLESGNGAPAVERQAVDAILLENCEEVTVQDYGRGYFATDDCVTQLYTSPPAPVAPSLWYIRVPDEPGNPESPCEYFYASSTFQRDILLRKKGAEIAIEYARIERGGQ
jgi:hypothetical protein